MASISDVFNALNDIKGKLDQLHADELTAHAKADATNDKLDALLGEIINAEDQARQIGLHLTKQNETIICALEHISHNTCALVTLADAQLVSARATEASSRTAAEVLRTAHPDAALELDRRDALQASIETCCMPEPRPPACEYDRCKDPGPLRLRDDRPR
jgi:hypothetical protein